MTEAWPFSDAAERNIKLEDIDHRINWLLWWELQRGWWFVNSAVPHGVKRLPGEAHE